MKLLDKYYVTRLMPVHQKYIKEFNIFPETAAQIKKLEKRVAEIIEQDEEFKASIFDFMLNHQTNIFRIYAYKMLTDDLRSIARQYALFLGSRAIIDYIARIDGSYSVRLNFFAKDLNFISIQHETNKNYEALYMSLALFEIAETPNRFAHITVNVLREDLEAQPELLCAYVKKHYKIDIEPAIVERLIQSPTRRINILVDIKEHVRQAQTLHVADFNDFGM